MTQLAPKVTSPHYELGVGINAGSEEAVPVMDTFQPETGRVLYWRYTLPLQNRSY
jgi:hypothetical protein